MRYALILAVSCVPLCFVTARSLIDPAAESCNANSPATVQDDDLGLAAKSLDMVTVSRKSGVADGAVALFLTSNDVLEMGPESQPLAEAPSLRAVLQQWQNRQTAMALMAKARDLPLAALTWKELQVDPGRLKDRETREKAFQAWSDEAGRQAKVLADFVQAERKGMITPRVAGFLDALAKQKAELEQEQQVPQAMIRAFALFKSDPAQCLSVLDGVALTAVRSQEQRDSVKEMIDYARANIGLWIAADQLAKQWGDDWTVDVDKLEPDKVEPQHRAIRNLLDQYPTATTPTHDNLVARADKLAARIVVLDRERAFGRHLAKLRQAKNLLDAEKIVGEIAAGHPNLTESLLRIGRERIAEWLTSTVFLKKEPPAKLLGREIEETLTNNQQRKIGVFFLPPDGLYYYFWKWDGAMDRASAPGGDEKLENAIKLDRPRYVRWAEEYNAALERLREGATKAQWLAFVGHCRKMQRELDEYRKRWGTQDEPDRSCSEWEFAPNATILAADNDDELCERLDKLQHVFGKAPE
jgi:hypothetical protein